jgi:hypothetical protein
LKGRLKKLMTDPVEVVVQCACSRLDHLVRFAFWPRRGSEPHEAFISVILDPERSFCKRVATAWRYLTRKTCGYVSVSECIVRAEDLSKLRAWLDQADVDAAKTAPSRMVS